MLLNHHSYCRSLVPSMLLRKQIRQNQNLLNNNDIKIYFTLSSSFTCLQGFSFRKTENVYGNLMYLRNLMLNMCRGENSVNVDCDSCLSIFFFSVPTILNFIYFMSYCPPVWIEFSVCFGKTLLNKFNSEFLFLNFFWNQRITSRTFCEYT